VMKFLELSIQEPPLPLRETIDRVDVHVMDTLKERKSLNKAWARVDVGQIEHGLSPLRRIAYVARHFFDSQLFVAAERRLSPDVR
jgi:hypothetical protein